MKFSVERRVMSGFIVVVVILAVLSVIFYYNGRKYKEDTLWVAHTREVVLGAEELLSLVLEIESSKRGYLLTGKMEFLSEYNIEKNEFNKKINNLKKLVSDNPLQIRRCDSLMLVGEKRVLLCEKVVQLKMQNADVKKTLYPLLIEGSTLMKKFQTIIKDFKNDEEKHLAVRINETKISIHEFNLAYIALVVFLTGTLITTFFILHYHLRLQEKQKKLIQKTNISLQSIIENIPVMLFKKNLKGEFELVNTKFANQFNKIPSDIIGRKSKDIISNEIAEFLISKEQEALVTKKNIEFEEHFNIGGKSKTLHHIFFPLLDKEGIAYAVCGLISDITERVKTEQKLLFQSFMINNASDAIIGVNLDFKITSINNAVKNIFGLPETEVIGQSVFKFLSCEEDESELAEKIKSEIKKNNEWRSECTAVNIHGQKIPLSTSFSYIKDNKNQITGLLSINRNIENEKKQQENISNLNQELEAFTYSVSHDLRAPLRSIDGYSQIMLEDYSDKVDLEGQRILKTLIRNARKMGVLIDDLLAFSKVSRQSISKTSVNMNSLLQTVITEVTEFNKKIVCVDLRKLPIIQGDHTMLHQVLVNLISNAIKYSSKVSHPIIEIGSESTTFDHTFYVKDNGEGFDMKYYHKLFTVFQRLHTVDDFEGTGIGLALVKRIISKHGGKVWAESEVTKGAVFYFSIPTGS